MAAARERVKPIASRVRHRRTRLEAVAFYRERFGEAEFLKPFSGEKLAPLKHYWLPGGYAYWKARIHGKST